MRLAIWLMALFFSLVNAYGQVRIVKRMDAFNAIDHRTGFNLVLTDRGIPGTVIIEGDKDAVGLITASVKDGTLHLAMEPAKNWLPRVPFFNARLEVRHKLRITAACRGLDTIRTQGSGSLTADGFRFRDLQIESVGGGSLRFQRCRFYSLETLLEGKGSIAFDRCEAVDTRLELEGEGVIYAHSLRTKNLDARVFGKGKITGYPRETLKAKVTGNGSILYRGNPSTLEKETAGGGKIDKYLEVSAGSESGKSQ